MGQKYEHQKLGKYEILLDGSMLVVHCETSEGAEWLYNSLTNDPRLKNKQVKSSSDDADESC